MPIYSLDGMRPTPSGEGHVWIAPSADLIGDVRLAEGSSVWFRAVIRADNTPIVIGERSNVQDGAMLHSDPGSPLTVGADVTIGHHAILHGCTIGNGALVGMGAIVLNGAIIGEGCLVGAGALVTEGKTFPPRSLIVGSPAKAKRELTDAEVEGLLNGARDYHRKASQYGKGLEQQSRSNTTRELE